MQEVPTLHRSQASAGGGGARRIECEMEGRSKVEERNHAGRKKIFHVQKRRVARGHFTLMAAGPIEMTAALHDLKVRRQRIIFQWWRRGIGEVKWCLSPPIPPPSPPPPRWIIAEQPRWNQHSAEARHHYTYARHTMETDRIAPVFPAPIHHNEKYCQWKFRGSVCENK